MENREEKQEEVDRLWLWKGSLRFSLSCVWEEMRTDYGTCRFLGPISCSGAGKSTCLTSWFPCEGSRDHTLRTWNRGETVSVNRRPANYSLNSIHEFEPLLGLEAESWAPRIRSSSPGPKGWGWGELRRLSSRQSREGPNKATCLPPGVWSWVLHVRAYRPRKWVDQQLSWEK